METSQYDITDIITDKIMYRTGEIVVLIGLFTTMVGAITMIYSSTVYTTKNQSDFV